MSIEDIIKAWKSDEDSWEDDVLASPVGEELSDEELEEVTGGGCGSYYTCWVPGSVAPVTFPPIPRVV